MEFTGTWRLAQPLHQWTRIIVHIPDHGAHTGQAEYVIDPGEGRTQRRTLLQRTQPNGWVPLGVFEVDGVPSVSLSTAMPDGDYQENDGKRLPAKNEDIAFDAVAFVALDAKPRDFVVALGDSYSSGEGAGTYYAETDTNKSNPRLQNGCHRSPLTWSRMGTLAGSTAKIGQRADSLDATLDYHLLACSGAFVENVTNRSGQAYQRFGERTQIARGFLDENTTLVTMSIGGNDAGFQGVIISCAILSECHTRTADDGTTYGQRIQRTIDHEVGPDVTDLLEEIHDEAPNARVLLMGYPKLFSGRCELITKLTLSEGEVGWMNDLARVLAERLSKAAVDANARAGTDYVTFTDPRPAFEGRGICGTPEHIHAGVLTPTDGDMLVIGSQQSFHPKAEGYLDHAWAMDLTLNPAGAVTTRSRRATLAAVLALTGLAAGCVPGGDLDATARGRASHQAATLLDGVERTVEENASATDDELVELLVTAVAERVDAAFELVGAPGRRRTWHAVATGAADGPVKSQARAAACFEVVVDRDAEPAVTATDRPCPDDVVDALREVAGEANVVSVEDVVRG